MHVNAAIDHPASAVSRRHKMLISHKFNETDSIPRANVHLA